MASAKKTTATKDSLELIESKNFIETKELNAHGLSIVSPADAAEYINKRYYAFNATKQLVQCWNSCQNALLFGPGGFGKSDVAIDFFNFLKLQGQIEEDAKPFVLSLGQGTTVENLLGGINIKKFTDTGELEYLLENSFIKHKYVIFEEIMDAIPQVLLELKDILQSGFVRKGTQLVPLECKMILGCTNRSREEVITDPSMEALYQRFQTEVMVTWKSFKEEDYAHALAVGNGIVQSNDTTTYPYYLQLVAKAAAGVMEEYRKANEETIVSPRTVAKIYQSVRYNGIEAVTSAYGFEKQGHLIIKLAQAYMEDKRQLDFLKGISEKSKDIAASIQTSGDSAIASNFIAARLLLDLYNELSTHTQELKNGVRDSVKPKMDASKESLKKQFDVCFKRGQTLMKEEHRQPGTLGAFIYGCKELSGAKKFISTTLVDEDFKKNLAE